MKKFFLMMMVFTLAIASVNAAVVDEFDFGDGTTDIAHSVSSMSGVWDWGGCYGGGDDGTLRTIIPRDPNCQNDDKEGFFTMTAPGAANALELRHLMGSQSDAYEVYLMYEGEWTKLTLTDSYDEVCGDCNSEECWYTDVYSLPEDATGELDFKVVATLDTIPSWCSSWGMNALSWAKLHGEESEIPEFGVVAGSLALLGAGYIALRKRR